MEHFDAFYVVFSDITPKDPGDVIMTSLWRHNDLSMRTSNFFVIFRHSMPSYIEICNFNEEYDKKNMGGQNCPLMVGPRSPPVSRDALGHRCPIFFSKCPDKFYEKSQKNASQYFTVFRLFSKNGEGGQNCPPPTWNRVNFQPIFNTSVWNITYHDLYQVTNSIFGENTQIGGVSPRPLLP